MTYFVTNRNIVLWSSLTHPPLFRLVGIMQIPSEAWLSPPFMLWLSPEQIGGNT